MGWKNMQEWSKASTVAGALVLSGSIAWAAFGPDDLGSGLGGTAASAWELPAADRPVIAATASQQLVTLNTMDPARVDQNLDAWERVTVADEHDRLRRSRAATRARYVRERETLSAARVSTVLPIASHAGSYGPDDTVRVDDKGWAHLMAVVRLTSTKPGGRPVEKVRRYYVYMVLTPHGWRISGLRDEPAGGVDGLVAYADGRPSRKDLMLTDVRDMMTALARGEGRHVLTGPAVGEYDQMWRRAGARPHRWASEAGPAMQIGIIRQDADSAELLVYFNLGITETVTHRSLTPSDMTSGKVPHAWITATQASDRGALALKVTIVPDGSDWQISRIQDA
ncbi:MAG: hypothetical protein ACRDNL_22030 [Spirillospora sp.]